MYLNEAEEAPLYVVSSTRGRGVGLYHETTALRSCPRVRYLKGKAEQNSSRKWNHTGRSPPKHNNAMFIQRAFEPNIHCFNHAL